MGPAGSPPRASTYLTDKSKRLPAESLRDKEDKSLNSDGYITIIPIYINRGARTSKGRDKTGVNTKTFKINSVTKRTRYQQVNQQMLKRAKVKFINGVVHLSFEGVAFLKYLFVNY